MDLSVPTDLEYCAAPGDSGGGWFINKNGQYILAGVTSFLAQNPINLNYPDSRYYDVFSATRVSSYLNWIGQYTTYSTSAPLTWTGGSSSTWSIAAGSGNWKFTTSGSAADYVNGAAVTFDDSATGTTADISAADVTPSSVTFNRNSTTTFTVTGAKGIAGATGLLKQGTGKVTLNSVNTYTGTTTVQAGTLELGLAAQAPVLANAGGADIQGGKLVLDYTSAVPNVLASLKASHDASPSWSIGQIRDTTASSTGLVLGWTNNAAAKQVTVMATLVGDADLSGSVTGDDLSLLLSKYDLAGNWSVGDFNYDGSVTGADLSLLLSNFNQSVPASVAGAAVFGVPEPSSLVMLAALAAAMGLGMVGRRRLASGLKLHLVKTFKVSNDPRFVETLVDVVGLHLNPPNIAWVISCDEKSQIQALDRTRKSLPMYPGRSGPLTYDYKRNGTSTLFAAIEVAEGKIIAERMPRHRHQEWLKVLGKIDAATPSDLDLHRIVDNHGTHKHPEVQRWLKRHARLGTRFAFCQ